MEQLPSPDAMAEVQDSPVLAFTVTMPLGRAPVTLKLVATDCAVVEGLGVLAVMVVAVAAFSAVIVRTTLGAGAYWALPACEAVRVQTPVPLVMEMAPPPKAQEPAAAMVTDR